MDEGSIYKTKHKVLLTAL